MADSPQPGSLPSQAEASVAQEPTRQDAANLQTPSEGGNSGRVNISEGSRPIPEYELVRQLGRGGFGEVWKAIGPGGVEVAMKFIRLGDQAGAVELRSLELMKSRRHAHLLALHGAWQRDNLLILAMELGDKTLLDRLHECCKRAGSVSDEVPDLPGIPGAELLEAMREAAKGIDHINSLGIQHRDIKPQNLLLVGGSVKVADFGLAKLLEHTVTSNSGAMTPAYAAPEFFSGKASSQSDQYALGVSYCQLRGGRLPFTGNAAQMMAGHLMHPPDLSMLPEAERPAVARSLAKKPEERWPSCRELVEAIGVACPESTKGAPRAPRSQALPGNASPRGSASQPVVPEAGVGSHHSLSTPQQVALPPTQLAHPTLKRKAWKSLAACLLVLLLSAALGGWFWFQSKTSEDQTRNEGPGDSTGLMGSTGFQPVQRDQRAGSVSDGDQTKEKTKPPAKEEPPKEDPKQMPSEVKKPDPPPPTLKLLPVEDITLEAGQTKSITVHVQRENCKDPIVVRLENSPAGVEPGRLLLAGDETSGSLKLTASADAAAAQQKVRLVAVAGAARAESEFNLLLKSKPVELAKDFTNSIGMKLVLIPAGNFMMGSPKEENYRKDDEMQHEVEITKPFHMGVHEVTQEEYLRVMGTNPSWFSATAGGKDKVQEMDTKRFPVEQVSWNDAVEFCRKLSELTEEKKTELVYRLPTEAEWEYACRGRGKSTSPFHFGNSLSSGQANFDGKFPAGGASRGLYLERMTKVGSYQPNAFGLHDMHGNVWEWCADWYEKDYYKASPSKNPEGPKNGKSRVLRGGSSDCPGWVCRAANRSKDVPGNRSQRHGFRVACSSTPRNPEPAEKVETRTGPAAEPPKEIAKPTLRFDGLYASPLERGRDYRDYMRFYKDGAVVTVGSTGRPEQVVKWLKSESDNPRGKYVVDGTTIIFDTVSDAGKVSYKGTIQENKLILKWQSYIGGGNKGEQTLEFLEMPVPP